MICILISTNRRTMSEPVEETITAEENIKVEIDGEEKANTKMVEVENLEQSDVATAENMLEEDDTNIADAETAETGSHSGTAEEEGATANEKQLESEVAVDENGDNDGFLVLEEDDLDDSNEVNDPNVNGDEDNMEDTMQDDVANTNDQQIEDNGCCDHASENILLRRAILELSERQTVLEEFIEVEYEEKFGKFMKNRERLVNIMGLEDEQDVTTTPVDGKRKSKSAELVGLLKVIKAQASASNSDKSRGTRIPTSTSSRQPSSSSRTAGGATNRDSNSSSKNHSPSKSNSRRSARTSSGRGGNLLSATSSPSASTTANKNVRACKCCFLTDHLLAQCPYRGKRPFEIRKEIQKRKQNYYDNVKDSSVSKVRRT
ncbi:hypothetical protein Ocin01_09520 [Orchesella cincta]|uniref:Uncharacterized protein n=1 Tax=Orchesella cincta TaxID=48709 RepID=A0A1D2MVM6_ORCCI|nr:hypothetical protein Ocin01_09520 [Orchesella cincta]